MESTNSSDSLTLRPLKLKDVHVDATVTNATVAATATDDIHLQASTSNTLKTIGAYEYNEKDEIDRGNFGAVYKGRNKTNLSQVVAIKKANITVDNNSKPNSTNQESEILKSLSKKRHPNIVTLLHFETQGRDAYFVMELCNGGNLQEYLKKNERLDERTIRIFLSQIAAGLKIAQELKIIHRDLKPANILLNFPGPKYPSPDKIIIKIADFGVGRFLHGDEKASTWCGTPMYMAPEIFLMRGHDYKVDMWSVGVIAYECRVGSLVLPKNSTIDLKEFKDPDDSTKDFIDLLHGLLEKDENKRFTLRQVLDHRFLVTPGQTIGISVIGPSGETKMIPANNNQSVDHMIDTVCTTFNIKAKDFYLVHEGDILEGEPGKLLREYDIKHGSSVFLNAVVRAGLAVDIGLPGEPLDKIKSTHQLIKESECWTSVGLTRLNQVQLNFYTPKQVLN